MFLLLIYNISIREKDLISPLVVLSEKFQYYVEQDRLLGILHYQVRLQNDFQVEVK